MDRSRVLMRRRLLVVIVLVGVASLVVAVPGPAPAAPSYVAAGGCVAAPICGFYSAGGTPRVVGIGATSGGVLHAAIYNYDDNWAVVASCESSGNPAVCDAVGRPLPMLSRLICAVYVEPANALDVATATCTSGTS